MTTWRKASCALAGATLLAVCATGAWAAPYGRRAEEKDIQRVRQKVEALRAWRLSEELDLDEATSARLFPALRQADDERIAAEAQNRRLLEDLAAALERQPADAEGVDALLRRLAENRRDALRAEERHLERVRKILSAEDTARYILFQGRFQAEIRDRVQRFRQERSAGVGPSEGGPPGRTGAGEGGRRW